MNAAHGTSLASADSRDRVLSSDLAKLCLPQEFRDPNRKLAWANSICALFLLVGVLGLKSHRISARPTSKPNELLPVFLVPADQPPKLKASKVPDQPGAAEDETVAQPAVASIVPVDANAIPFAVPVADPVALSPARLTAMAPATNRMPASLKSTPFVPSIADWGGHPVPEYPPLASRRGYQGKVVLEIMVAPSGEVSSVKVKESSGYKILDDTAVEHVRRHLRLRQPPGETRLHTLDIIFQLKP